jgi:hypothetical protein
MSSSIFKIKTKTNKIVPIINNDNYPELCAHHTINNTMNFKKASLKNNEVINCKKLLPDGWIVLKEKEEEKEKKEEEEEEDDSEDHKLQVNDVLKKMTNNWVEYRSNYNLKYGDGAYESLYKIDTIDYNDEYYEYYDDSEEIID